MDIYNYDPRTGAFTGQSEADESPMEPGKFLVPAYAVLTPPPPATGGDIAAWNGSSWVVVPDRRGQVWFNRDGFQVLVDFLGDPASRGLLADRPAPPSTVPVDENGFPFLSPRQIRLGLLSIGITGDVITTALLATEAKDAALIEWQYATSFKRDHALIVAVSKVLDLPAEQVDGLWVYAAAI